MLEKIRRWLRSAAAHAEFDPVQTWAQQRRWQFKRSRDGEGFIIEPEVAPAPWRLEWGPSQRHYIAGGELRLRAEVAPGTDLQLLLLSRGLMERMEKEVFEQYTESLQTRVDTDTPEEMRWLVLFPKVGAAELKGLRELFGGVAPVPALLASWLEGPLAEKLMQYRTGLGVPDPLLLIVQRGRLTLRTPVAVPEPQRLAAALALFEVATREARRVAQTAGSVPTSAAPGGFGDSTLSTRL